MSPKPKLSDAFHNFSKALTSLDGASKRDCRDPVIVAGIVQNFEFTYELTWLCLKRVLEVGGHSTGMARDVFLKAFQLGVISEEKSWLKMIEDRNATVHTYDQEFAKEMIERIIQIYLPLFKKIHTSVNSHLK